MSAKVLQDSNHDLGIQFGDLLNSLSALRSLVSVDIQASDESGLVRNAMRALMQNQDMARCSVFLLKGDYLENISGLGLEDLCEPIDETRVRTPQRFKLGEGLVGQAALTKTLQCSHDCATDPRFRWKSGQTERERPGSLISAPLELSGEVIGVLNISHPYPSFFTEWHKRLLTVYCRVLAQLILNSRLFHQMETRIEEKTKQLESALEKAQQLKEQFETLSMVDDLTGLHNRRYFFPEGEAALSRAVRYRLSMGILLLDLDHFKRINDNYGHDVGDRVLHDIAQELKKAVREGDIVARYGGEEFVIVGPNTDGQQCYLLASRIRQAISELRWNHQDEKISVTVSLGVCHFDMRSHLSIESTLMGLLKRADMALYEAKARGRNKVIVYNDVTMANSG